MFGSQRQSPNPEDLPCELVAGEKCIHEELLGLEFRISPYYFFPGEYPMSCIIAVDSSSFLPTIFGQFGIIILSSRKLYFLSHFKSLSSKLVSLKYGITLVYSCIICHWAGEHRGSRGTVLSCRRMGPAGQGQHCAGCMLQRRNYWHLPG